MNNNYCFGPHELLRIHNYNLGIMESLLHASLCFQTYLNVINIIIDVDNKLLDSITVTAKSSEKM